MDQTNNRDDALFEALSKSRKKKKRKTARTVILVLLVLGVLLAAGVFFLRRQVAKRFASGGDEVVSAEASVGSISTQVSGSGTLLNVGEENLFVPAGVAVEELLVSAQESVTEGQLLATVDIASVQTAMSGVQTELTALDKEITSAAKDTVDSRITAGVAGRVKLIYAEKGDDVAKCMYEHGALAVLSLDGKMALEIDAGKLASGDTVLVRREDGSELEGTVDAVVNEKATILVTDNGPRAGETVTVLDADGAILGTGALSIHSLLRVSGISGTISGVYAQENRTASSSSGVTRYSAVITMDKTPEMLQGMSAKVVVRIQGVDNAVIVPAAALHQTSSTSYVYTSYDEETKEFGGLREVTVGITNSSYAEITSGLQAGETVYYTEAEDSFFSMGFGGGGFPGGSGGGGFSGGGDRPSGGGRG